MTTARKTEDHLPADQAHLDEAWHEVVRQHVRSLRFGVVQVVVHDGRVTQIERTERVRFERPAATH